MIETAPLSQMRTSGTRVTRRSILRSALAAATVAAARPLLARQPPASLRGRNAGEERQVDSIKLCWCPPGRFVMGSPSNETGHRPDEAQVDVTLTKGFWMDIGFRVVAVQA